MDENIVQRWLSAIYCIYFVFYYNDSTVETMNDLNMKNRGKDKCGMI
jgi:hypothetical protein